MKRRVKFGKHLRKLRESSKLSLRQLERLCGVDHVKLFEVEHGVTDLSLWEFVDVCRKGLGMMPDSVITVYYEKEGTK